MFDLAVSQTPAETPYWASQVSASSLGSVLFSCEFFSICLVSVFIDSSYEMAVHVDFYLAPLQGKAPSVSLLTFLNCSL